MQSTDSVHSAAPSGQVASPLTVDVQSGNAPSAEGSVLKWDRKDVWRKYGKDFLVTVERYDGTADHYEGPNRWAVYAYIYPKHPHFAAFDGPRMWQEAATCLPLHGGPSLLEYPMYEGKVTSVKVGADYHHLHDDFTHYATQEQAWEVFDDAARLWHWLQSKAEPPASGAFPSGATTVNAEGTFASSEPNGQEQSLQLSPGEHLESETQQAVQSKENKQ